MRRTILFASFGAILLLVAWWFFFISPRNGQIDDARRDLVAAQDEEARLRGQIAGLQEIADSEVEYLAAIGELQALIPDRPLLEEFIEQINDLALSTGVNLETLAPSIPTAVSEDSDLRQINVVATCQGQFFDVMGFLFGLMEMDRLVRLDGVALASVAEEGDITNLAVTLEMKLFTLADLVPAVVEESPEGSEGGDGTGEAGEET